jgi:hypothetical protein
MRDHSLLVRQAVVMALLADAGVLAIVGQRVYGETVDPEMPIWPSDTNPAYVKMGLPVTSPSEPSGLNGGEIRFAVHGFAAGPSSDLAEQLKGAVIAALDLKPLPLSGGAVMRDLRCQLSSTVSDTGSPSDFHVIVQFAALTAERA